MDSGGEGIRGRVSVERILRGIVFFLLQSLSICEIPVIKCCWANIATVHSVIRLVSCLVGGLDCLFLCFAYTVLIKSNNIYDVSKIGLEGNERLGLND